MAVPAWSRRRWALLAGALGTVLAGLAAWLLWPEPTALSPPRERQYRSTTACLLTPDTSLDAEPAKAAWAGMQEASLATLIKVQHLTISGPQTAANGLSYYNTLAVQKCTVIIAAGEVPVQAMLLGHQHFPNIRHVAIGGSTNGTPVATVDTQSPSTIRSDVKSIVSAAA